MSEHKAEIIMKKVVSILSGLETTGDSVKRCRGYNWGEEELPAIAIFMGEETLLQEEIRNISLLDVLQTVYIESSVSDFDYAKTESLLNLIRAEVTTALREDYTLGLNFVIDLMELGAQRPELNTDGDKPISKQEFSFAIKYRRSVNDPRL